MQMIIRRERAEHLLNQGMLPADPRVECDSPDFEAIISFRISPNPKHLLCDQCFKDKDIRTAYILRQLGSNK